MTDKSSTCAQPNISTVEKYRRAFAEAGYPDAPVMRRLDGKVGLLGGDDIPLSVRYQAFLITSTVDVCFECWNRTRFADAKVQDCPHGRQKLPQVCSEDEL